MPRSFTASTDAVQAAAFVPSTAVSFAFWVKNPTATGTAFKGLMNHGVRSRVSINAEQFGGGVAAGGAIYFARSWSTTDHISEVQTPTNLSGGSWANWNHIAVTYDGSATTNVATIYVNGVAQTNSFTRASAGTIDAATDTPTIGNISAKTASSLGEFAWCGLYNVVLTAVEVKAAMAYGFHTRGLVWAQVLGLGSPEPDWSGNGRTGTVTGTTITAAALVQRTVLAQPNLYDGRANARTICAKSRRRSPRVICQGKAPLVYVKQTVVVVGNARRQPRVIRAVVNHRENARILRAPQAAPPVFTRPTIIVAGSKRASRVRAYFRRHAPHTVTPRASLTAAASVSATDGAALADATSALAAAAATTDGAALADATSALAAAAATTDAGALADATSALAAAAATTDAGAGTEAVGGLALSGPSDSGAVTDATSAVSAATAGSDSASTSDVAGSLALSGPSDAGVAADAASALAAMIAAIDAGGAAELATLVASAASSDTAAPTEQSLITAVLAAIDALAATEGAGAIVISGLTPPTRPFDARDPGGQTGAAGNLALVGGRPGGQT